MREDIEVRASDSAAAKRGNQCVLVDNVTASHVDYMGCARQTCERRRVNKKARFRAERAAQHQPVRLRQQLMQLRVLHRRNVCTR